MPYEGPGDAYYDPPDEGRETETGECSKCKVDKEIMVDTQMCQTCEEDLESTEQERKSDEAKDEGKLRR